MLEKDTMDLLHFKQQLAESLMLVCLPISPGRKRERPSISPLQEELLQTTLAPIRKIKLLIVLHWKKLKKMATITFLYMMIVKKQYGAKNSTVKDGRMCNVPSVKYIYALQKNNSFFDYHQ